MELLILFFVVSFPLVLFGVRGLVLLSKLAGYFLLFFLVYMLLLKPAYNTLKEGGAGLVFILFILFLMGLGLIFLFDWLSKKMASKT